MDKGIDNFWKSLGQFKIEIDSGNLNDALTDDERLVLDFIFDDVMLQAQDESGKQIIKENGKEMRDIVCFFYVPAAKFVRDKDKPYSLYVKAINGLIRKGVLYKTGRLRKYGRGYTHLYNWNGDLLALIERLRETAKYGEMESLVSPAEYIIHALSDGPKTIQQMVDESGITRSRIGYALGQLESDGKITIEKTGKFKSIKLAVNNE